MSKISRNLNHSPVDTRKLNHLELQKYLGRCLDPLLGLPDLGRGGDARPCPDQTTRHLGADTPAARDA